jgi:hypothetical protein
LTSDAIDRRRNVVHAAAPSVQRRDRDTTAMYLNNDTLEERLRLYVEENFHDS